jgi:hypothetical protein
MMKQETLFFLLREPLNQRTKKETMEKKGKRFYPATDPTLAVGRIASFARAVLRGPDFGPLHFFAFYHHKRRSWAYYGQVSSLFFL